MNTLNIGLNKNYNQNILCEKNGIYENKDEEYDEFAKSILYYYGDKDSNLDTNKDEEYDEFAKSILYYYDN